MLHHEDVACSTLEDKHPWRQQVTVGVIDSVADHPDVLCLEHHRLEEHQDQLQPYAFSLPHQPN